jgi:hypothetical protein
MENIFLVLIAAVDELLQVVSVFDQFCISAYCTEYYNRSTVAKFTNQLLKS